MKKNLITLILSITTTACFAQAVNIGVKGGINFAKQALNLGLANTSTKALAGYNLGVMVDFGYDKFSIQPGLMLTTKGERFGSQDTDPNDDVVAGPAPKYILTYLELPINFLYKINATHDAQVHLGGGPYFAYGLAAKVSSGGATYNGGFGNHSADPNYGPYYKNPDYGLNFIAGAVLQMQYVFDVQYGLGLGNLSYSNTTTLKNKVISVSVGYMFK